MTGRFPDEESALDGVQSPLFLWPKLTVPSTVEPANTPSSMELRPESPDRLAFVEPLLEPAEAFGSTEPLPDSTETTGRTESSLEPAETPRPTEPLLEPANMPGPVEALLEVGPAERMVLPATTHGTDVLAICERALDWAANERHSVVKIDTFLFALTEREAGAASLRDGGIIDVDGLEIELLSVVHRLRIPQLIKGEKPRFDDCVLSLLARSQAYARDGERDETALVDVISALGDIFKVSQPSNPGLLALQRRWPGISRIDASQQLLANVEQRLAQLNGEKYQLLADIRVLLDQSSFATANIIEGRLERLEKRLEEALPSLSTKVNAVENVAPTGEAKEHTSWLRRMNAALFTIAGITISSAVYGAINSPR